MHRRNDLSTVNRTVKARRSEIHQLRNARIAMRQNVHRTNAVVSAATEDKSLPAKPKPAFMEIMRKTNRIRGVSRC